MVTEPTTVRSPVTAAAAAALAEVEKVAAVRVVGEEVEGCLAVMATSVAQVEAQEVGRVFGR